MRRTAAGPTTKAVLHLHGFADYFFQTGYAEWWTERGYDFYALDLRKYGRSLRPTRPRTTSPTCATTTPRSTRPGSGSPSATATPTWSSPRTPPGGLVVGLWADDRRPAQLVGAVLNSPWLDLQGSALLRVVGTPVLKQVGARQPMREIKRHVTGFYTRSLHRDHEGEWDFDLLWKPIESFTVYAGWLRAVREGHARLHRGLELPCPVLVLSSGRSALPEEMGEDVHGTDIVLDVAQIRRWATAYGRHVTYVAIEGARHDVVLSREEPRGRRTTRSGRWMAA